jgi:hypothetical protein
MNYWKTYNEHPPVQNQTRHGWIIIAFANRLMVLIRSCSQKTMNIHVILNGAELREASQGLKKRDSSRRSE